MHRSAAARRRVVRHTSAVHEHDISSADGTRIRVWRSGGDSSGDVLLCPGLGTMPEAWPFLGGQDGPRVHSWYHRGTLGSARPADRSKVRLADHMADAVAVLDDAGAERAVVIGWSVGVGVAVELALRYPDRVSGLLLVAGAPGDPFEGMFGVLGAFGVPSGVRKRLAEGAAKVIRDTGPLLNAVLHRVPVNPLTAAVVRHSGLMRPASPTEHVVAAGRRFLSHDWQWYGELALALAREEPPTLAGVHCPVTVVTGRYDVLADPKHVAKAMGALPQAKLRVLPTSHFLPLEAPVELAEELRQLIERADAVRGATHWAVRTPRPPLKVVAPAAKGLRWPAPIQVRLH